MGQLEKIALDEEKRDINHEEALFHNNVITATEHSICANYTTDEIGRILSIESPYLSRNDVIAREDFLMIFTMAFDTFRTGGQNSQNIAGYISFCQDFLAEIQKGLMPKEKALSLYSDLKKSPEFKNILRKACENIYVTEGNGLQLKEKLQRQNDYLKVNNIFDAIDESLIKIVDFSSVLDDGESVESVCTFSQTKGYVFYAVILKESNKIINIIKRKDGKIVRLQKEEPFVNLNMLDVVDVADKVFFLEGNNTSTGGGIWGKVKGMFNEDGEKLARLDDLQIECSGRQLYVSASDSCHHTNGILDKEKLVENNIVLCDYIDRDIFPGYVYIKEDLGERMFIKDHDSQEIIYEFAKGEDLCWKEDVLTEEEEKEYFVIFRNRRIIKIHFKTGGEEELDNGLNLVQSIGKKLPLYNSTHDFVTHGLDILLKKLKIDEEDLLLDGEEESASWKRVMERIENYNFGSDKDISQDCKDSLLTQKKIYSSLKNSSLKKELKGSLKGGTRSIGNISVYGREEFYVTQSNVYRILGNNAEGNKSFEASEGVGTERKTVGNYNILENIITGKKKLVENNCGSLELGKFLEVGEGIVGRGERLEGYFDIENKKTYISENNGDIICIDLNELRSTLNKKEKVFSFNFGDKNYFLFPEIGAIRFGDA